MGIEISLAGVVPPGNDACIALDAAASGLPQVFSERPVEGVTVLSGGRLAKVESDGLCTTYTVVGFRTGDLTAQLLVPESLATSDGIDEWVGAVRAGLTEAREELSKPDASLITEGTGFTVRCASTDCSVLVTENDSWAISRDVSAPIVAGIGLGAFAVGGALAAAAIKLHVATRLKDALDRFTQLGVVRKSSADKTLAKREAAARPTLFDHESS